MKQNLYVFNINFCEYLRFSLHYRHVSPFYRTFQPPPLDIFHAHQMKEVFSGSRSYIRVVVTSEALGRRISSSEPDLKVLEFSICNENRKYSQKFMLKNI